MTFRLLAQFPCTVPLSMVEPQTVFEAWAKKFPHIDELHQKEKLMVSVSDSKEFVIKTSMTDKEWLLWCIKHPDTPLKK